MSENQQDQGKEAKKIAQAFEANVRKLVAIVGGVDKITVNPKLPVDTLAAVIDDLFKEDRETTVKEVKDGVRNLIKAKVGYENAKKQKEEEFKKLDLEKKKEFNKAAQDLFKRITKLNEYEAQYYQALGDTATAVGDTEEITEETE